MHPSLLLPGFLLILLVAQCSLANPSVEWRQNWSGRLPASGNGMHRGYVGFGSDNDGRKYVENGWQNSWRSGQNDGNSGWNRKQTGNDNWDMSGKRKWFWENGGSHGWGQWGSDLSGDLSDSIPELYTTWGNSNTDSWKNHGGGEGWQKWEADDEGAGSGSRQYGGWRSWKSGSGGGRWKSWKNGGADGGGNLMSWKIGGNKPINAKAGAFATAFIDP